VIDRKRRLRADGALAGAPGLGYAPFMQPSHPASTGSHLDLSRAGRRPVSRRWAAALLAAPLVLAAGCSSDAGGPCTGVGCSGHGICTSVADIAYCICADGYHPVGLDCRVNDPLDPCRGVTCSGHGTCRVVDTAPTCDCADGFVADAVTGLSCLPEPHPDGGDGGGGDTRDDAAPDDAAPEEVAPPRCGDGHVDDGEECDDGNFTSGDGCESDCRYSCHGDSECGASGLCRVGFCTPGHYCDERWVGDGTSCEFGRCCSGSCVDTTADASNCGSCGTVCWPPLYCFAGACYPAPTFEQGPECSDMGIAHPPPDVLGYYTVRGRPGAQVHKWNVHTSCGASAELAPETEPPNPPMLIGADGSVTFSISTGEPITECAHSNLGTYDSWVVVDGLESNHDPAAFYNSLCPAVQTCDLGAAFCPP
jgi:cysteine-rich repeat protein